MSRRLLEEQAPGLGVGPELGVWGHDDDVHVADLRDVEGPLAVVLARFAKSVDRHLALVGADEVTADLRVVEDQHGFRPRLHIAQGCGDLLERVGLLHPGQRRPKEALVNA